MACLEIWVNCHLRSSKCRRLNCRCWF